MKDGDYVYVEDHKGDRFAARVRGTETNGEIPVEFPDGYKCGWIARQVMVCTSGKAQSEFWRKNSAYERKSERDPRAEFVAAITEANESLKKRGLLK